MRYKGRRQSSNIEDRRAMSTGKKIGIRGGIASVVIAIIVLLLGGDPSAILNLLQFAPQQTETAGDYQPTAQEEELAEFVGVVLADTEDVWNKLFNQMGLTYREPKLVLFNGQVSSACGFSSAATGPFYCPGDERVYIARLSELSKKRRVMA